jgi:hypothetical protein
MPALGEKVEKTLSDFVTCHGKFLKCIELTSIVANESESSARAKFFLAIFLLSVLSAS